MELTREIANILNTSIAYLSGESNETGQGQLSHATTARPEPSFESNVRLADDEMGLVPIVSTEVKVCCGPGNIYPDEVIWQEIGAWPIEKKVLMGYSWQVGDGGYHIITSEGDSMEPFVYSGNKILIADIRPNNGDIGIFLYKGKMLLRGVIFEKDGIRLHASNKDYDDIFVPNDDLDDLCLLGKMLGVVPDFIHRSSIYG